MKGRFLQALDGEFATHPDMVALFGKNRSTMQCIMSGNYEHMHERLLISHPFKLQMWSPEKRPIEMPPRFARLAFQGKRPDSLPLHLKWLTEVFAPLKNANEAYHVMKKGMDVREIQWFFTERALPEPAAGLVLLLARHPFTQQPYKEALVYKHHRMAQVFAVFSHGRRFYRTLEHATNATLTLHAMQSSSDRRETSWPDWGRHEAGGPDDAEACEPSLVIYRERLFNLAHENDDPEARARTAEKAARAQERAAKELVLQEQQEVVAREMQMAELAAKAAAPEEIELVDEWNAEEPVAAVAVAATPQPSGVTRLGGGNDDGDDDELGGGDLELEMPTLEAPSAQLIESLQDKLAMRTFQRNAVLNCWNAACGADAGVVYRVESAHVASELNDDMGVLLPAGTKFEHDHLRGFWVSGAGAGCANGLYLREGIDESGLPWFRMGDYTLRSHVSKAGRHWALAHAPRSGSAAPVDCYVSCAATASMTLYLPPTVDQQLPLDESVRDGEDGVGSGAAAEAAVRESDCGAQQTWGVSSEVELAPPPSVRALLLPMDQRGVTANDFGSRPIALTEACAIGCPSIVLNAEGGKTRVFFEVDVHEHGEGLMIGFALPSYPRTKAVAKKWAALSTAERALVHGLNFDSKGWDAKERQVCNRSPGRLVFRSP